MNLQNITENLSQEDKIINVIGLAAREGNINYTSYELGKRVVKALEKANYQIVKKD